MTLLKRNDELAYLANDTLEFVAGDTRDFTVLHPDLDADEISEVIFHAVNSSGTVVIELSDDDTPTQVVVSDGSTKIILASTDSVGLSGNLSFQVEITLINSEVFSPLTGTIVLNTDTVNDDETASYLSRTTRADLQADIDAFEIANDITRLTSAASSGASSITVDNVAIFSASDNIKVVLGDPFDSGTSTAESHQIAGAWGGTNPVTLVGTLGDDCAAGNIVAKV